MISTKLQDALNAQIVAEMWSANIYLSMSYYFSGTGYNGFAHWMKLQAKEENEHAERIAGYLQERGGIVRLGAIDAVPLQWDSPEAAFQYVYQHECKVSKMIDNLMDLAIAEKDYATQNHLWWFVNEQVEEEANASAILDQFKVCGGHALHHLDAELAQRK